MECKRETKLLGAFESRLSALTATHFGAEK